MGRRRETNPGDPPHLHRKGQVWYHVTGTRPRKWTALGSNKGVAIQRCEEIEQDRLTTEALYWLSVNDELRAILARNVGMPEAAAKPAALVSELRTLLRKVHEHGSST